MFLSIVAVFCDKDVQYVPNLLNIIEEKVKVSHEVILIDNRENNKDTIDFKGAEVHTKGYNAYQFEARRFAVQFCKGEYIWFIDSDDNILTVKKDLENTLKEDLIIFNYMVERNVLLLPFSWRFTKEAFKRKRFTSIKRPNLMEWCPTNDLWDICCCTMWNKWVKRNLMEEIVSLVPSDEIIVASEDVLYASLILDRCDTINFCDDTIYIYKEGLACGNELEMTVDKFFHIIKGYDKARALFEKLIKDHQIYNNVETNVAYFYSKLIFSEDPDICFLHMKKYFTDEELKAGLVHPWIPDLPIKKQELLIKLAETHL